MNMKTYLTESGRTAAGVMHSSLVAPAYTLKRLIDFNLFAAHLDQVKKCLFYKRDTLTSTNHELRYQSELSLDHIPTDVVHALLGVISEAGELGELLEESIRTGEPIDSQSLKDESGDILWYLAMLFRHLGTSFEEVGELNIEKLRVRFPDKFTYETVNNKDHEAENKVFR